jgi:DNA-binding transcriptional MerR regulator
MKLLHGLEGKIGQVAQLTGMTVKVIRYYEKEKILNPERSQGSTYRTYDVWKN